jgi:hypothetical protein
MFAMLYSWTDSGFKSAVPRDTVRRRTGIMHDIGVEPEVVRHANRGLDAHVREESGADETLHAAPAQLDFERGAHERAVDVLADDQFTARWLETGLEPAGRERELKRRGGLARIVAREDHVTAFSSPPRSSEAMLSSAAGLFRRPVGPPQWANTSTPVCASMTSSAVSAEKRSITSCASVRALRRLLWTDPGRKESPAAISGFRAMPVSVQIENRRNPQGHW